MLWKIKKNYHSLNKNNLSEELIGIKQNKSIGQLCLSQKFEKYYYCYRIRFYLGKHRRRSIELCQKITQRSNQLILVFLSIYDIRHTTKIFYFHEVPM